MSPHVHVDRIRNTDTSAMNSSQSRSDTSATPTHQRNRHKHDIGNYIRAIAQSGSNVDRALKIFQTMLDWGYSPTLNTFNALITVANKAGNLSLCWDFVNRMKFEFECDANHDTYQILFSSMMRESQYHDIVQHFSDMEQQCDALRDNSSYHDALMCTLFHVLPTTLLAHGRLDDVDAAKTLFNKYYTLLSQFMASHAHDTELCTRLRVCFNSMVNTMVSMVTTVDDDTESALRFLQQMSASPTSSSDDSMLQVRYRDYHAFVSLLKAMSRLDDSKQQKRSHSKNNSNERQMSKMMSVYEHALQQHEKSESGRRLPIELFNVMLAQCNHSRSFEHASRIWNDRQQLRVTPDAFTYTQYLQCVVYSLQLRDIPALLERIMDDCRKRNATPQTQKQKETKTRVMSQYLATTMMWASIECHRHVQFEHPLSLATHDDHNEEDDSLDVQQQSEPTPRSRRALSPRDIFEICKYEFDMLPTIDMYNELLYFALKFYNYEDALLIIDEMIAWDLTFDTRTYNIFISGMGKLHRMDVVQELLLDMQQSQCRMNGATYLNLLDAFAQNGEVALAEQYLAQFAEACKDARNAHFGLYIDKNCYSHVINCYANCFAQPPTPMASKDEDVDVDVESLLEWNENAMDEYFDGMTAKLNRVFEHWNLLCTHDKYKSTLCVADYILMLKCLRNYLVNLNLFDMEQNEPFHAKREETKQYVVQMFDAQVLQTTQWDAESSNNKHTAFNLLLDILYEVKDIELGLHYFEMAQSMKIWNIYHKFNPQRSEYVIDLHSLRRHPAIFAVLHYLQRLRETYQEQRMNGAEWNHKQHKYSIITGVAMHSVDWVPTLKPLVLHLLSNGFEGHTFSSHITSYNEGEILLDTDCVLKYLTSERCIHLKN